MGSADVAQQKSVKAPSWAWKGADKGHPPLVSSPIAGLAARLAAIRVGQTTARTPSAKPADVSTDARPPVWTRSADVSADDNKENLGGWRREMSFEERLKGAAKSRADVTSAGGGMTSARADMTSAAVQTVHELRSFKSTPAIRTEVDSKVASLSRDRLNCERQFQPETSASGQWMRMWTQLLEPDAELADDVSSSGGVGAVQGGQETGVAKAAGECSGTDTTFSGRDASLHTHKSSLDADISKLPHQVDATSYLLGERAALERAFQQVVPQRDQVTTLNGAVAQLQNVTQQESGRLRRLENAGSVLHSSVSSANERLLRIEQAVPALEVSLAEMRGHLEGMAFMASELSAVRASLAALEANQDQIKERLSYTSSTFFKLLTGSWGRLLGYLARADVAALYLARKILLDPTEASQPSLPVFESPSLPDDSFPPSEKVDWSADHMHALARAISRHRRVRSAAGAILVVAAVEATWRLQRAARRPLPKVLRSMTVPVDTCLRIARVCVWASAFVVGAEELKKGCYSVADSVAKLQDTVAEGIRVRSSLIADSVTEQGLQLRTKWGQMRKSMAQYGQRLGFEGPLEKAGDDLKEVVVPENGCRAVGLVSEYGFEYSISTRT